VSKKKISLHKKILVLIDFLIMAVIIVLDQLSKKYVIEELKGKGSLIIIDNILQLTYKENSGTILGFLNNQKLFILFVGVIIITLVFAVLIRLPDAKKYNAANILLSFILAGALANLLDRFNYGYVIDYIYFIGIDFPIFNLADFFILIGCLVIILLLVFYYKENDLAFLNLKKAYFRELK